MRSRECKRTNGKQRKDVLLAVSFTHWRICLRVEFFLSSSQYQATVNRLTQFLIKMGITPILPEIKKMMSRSACLFRWESEGEMCAKRFRETG